MFPELDERFPDGMQLMPAISTDEYCDKNMWREPGDPVARPSFDPDEWGFAGAIDVRADGRARGDDDEDEDEDDDDDLDFDDDFDDDDLDDDLDDDFDDDDESDFDDDDD